MPFSQPASDQAPTTALISLVADAALRDGNADSVRAMLGADSGIVARFDMALTAARLRGDAPEQEKARRLSLRAQDELEKRRAARHAVDTLAAEERAALYAAADADGDTLTTLSPLELDTLPEAELLVEGFLVKESVARLYGPPKSYKSFVMLDLAACVGAGIPWCGKYKTTQARVLYVVAEGVRGIRRRVRAWESVNKKAMVGVQFYDRAVQLGDRNDVARLIRTAKRGNYEFIVLDTQARCTVGLEENSASEMGVVVAALDVLKEVTGACVALVHHSGASGGRARGSTAILGALDAEFEVEADKDSMMVTVHTRAQKDLAEAKSVEFDLASPADGRSLAVRPRRDWYQPSAADLAPLPADQMAVLRTLSAFGQLGATPDMIAKDMGLDKIPFRKLLSQLQGRGCVFLKGNTVRIDRVGKVHLSGTLDSVRED